MSANAINNQSGSSTHSLQQADHNIEAGKSHAKDGAHDAKKATINFVQGTKDFLAGGATKAKHGAQYAGHAAFEVGARSRINSPYALVSPGKGVAVAAVLAGAGYLAPRFTTASYAITLTLPGVAFTAAALLLAAAVYSWIANAVHKPSVPAGTDLSTIHASLQEKVENIKARQAQIDKEVEALNKESAQIAAKKTEQAHKAQQEAKAAELVAKEGHTQAA